MEKNYSVQIWYLHTQTVINSCLYG